MSPHRALAQHSRYLVEAQVKLRQRLAPSQQPRQPDRYLRTGVVPAQIKMKEGNCTSSAPLPLDPLPLDRLDCCSSQDEPASCTPPAP
eukprot:3856497-Rhodomonas_salina.1